MESALTNSTVGYAIPSDNIIREHNISFSGFRDAISEMNSKNLSELHIYISTHGTESNSFFFDGMAIKTAVVPKNWTM